MGTFNRIPLWILLVILAPLNIQGQYEALDSPSQENGPLDYDIGQAIQQQQQQQQQQDIINGGQRITVIKATNKLPVKAINVAHNNRVCSTWGNFHFKNFDGDIFHFPGTCNYVFSSHCQSTYEDFNIHIRRSLQGNTPVIEKIVMKLDGLAVELSHSAVLISDKQVQLPYSAGGVQIDKHGVYLTVTAKLGLVLMWNDDDSLLLELDSKYANSTCGLCGDFNGISTYNEFIANGVLITAEQFGNLQKFDGPTEQCNDVPPSLVNNCEDNENICASVLRGSAFSNCHPLVPVEPYIIACMQDLCQCDSLVVGQCLCDTFSEYSRQCAHAGGHPQNWRTKDLCPKTCAYNMEYQECGSPCEDSCTNPERSVLCENHCMEGCFCPPGTVFDDINKSGCVPLEQCPCTFNSHTYDAGKSYDLPCSSCVCMGGKWQCENKPCQGRCSIEGGSHITTYDQTRYSIHGDCNYVLSKTCDGESFIVLSELRKCGLTESESCLKSATIILNGDTIIVIKPCGSVFVNSIYTQLPVSAANVIIFRPSSFFIIVQTQIGVQIVAQLTPLMQVYVALDPSYKGQTCGLCGNFNDKQTDDFLTMSGVIEGTAASFANTWKTQGTCSNIKNLYEDPCALSVENEKYAKHWCGLLTDKTGPFAPCHDVLDPARYLEICMYDTCNCEKSEDCMCSSLSSYAHACAAKGVILTGWRSTVCTKYMNSCPKSLTYTYSTNTCQPTCRSLSEDDVTCSITFDPVDGCTCAKDFYMDDSGKCIPAAACPCYYKGSPVPSGEVVHDNGMMCTCIKGKLNCMGAIKPACQAPMVYFDCTNATVGTKGSECQKSCQTLDMACYSAKCASGCVCPAGLIADGKGGCIKEEDCPCVHNDAMYKPGEQVKMKCNTCTCKDRMWQCTDKPCLETCAVYGDGHYVTFDGKRYEFSGDCEYVLAQDHCGQADSGSSTFSVITENIPCGTTGTTCSKSIKVFLGSYELIMTEEKIELVEREIGGVLPYAVRHMGIYLVIEADNGLILMWDKKTSIFIKLSKDFEGKVCGLCGNLDGDGNNDFTTRSQSVVGDASQFGNSWKISNSCPDAKIPKDACNANPYRKSWAQKQCSILNSHVFSSCHSLVDSSKFYDACVSDACACDSGGDCECFCTAVAAYAQACGEAGICVSWRTPSVCPLFCDYFNPEGQCDWHYKPCGSPCMKTCRNPSGKCLNELSGLEGCYPRCPAERPFYDEDEMKCVDRCGCYDDNGKHFRIGELVPSEKNCQKCECTLSGVDCKYEKEACHCEYNGKTYRYDQTIYDTTDGIGGCITAICKANGTISRETYPCPVTSTTPFTFTTTPQPVPTKTIPTTHTSTVSTETIPTTHTTTSSTETIPTTHTTTSSTETIPTTHTTTSSTETIPTTHTTTSSTEKVPTTQTSPASTRPKPTAHTVCVKIYCQWSQWFDSSYPDFGMENGDFDTYDNIIAKGHSICKKPEDIECRAKKFPDTPVTELKQNVQCNVSFGLICRNKDQRPPICYNYEIRVKCCSLVPCDFKPPTTPTETTFKTTETSTHPTSQNITTHPITTASTTLSNVPSSTVCPPKCKWTPWLDVSMPGVGEGEGDFETYDRIKEAGHRICPKPYDIQCRAEKTPEVPISNIGQIFQCNVTVGLVCHNEDQEGIFKQCLNYQIKVLCCDDYIHCGKEETTATTHTQEKTTNIPQTVPTETHTTTISPPETTTSSTTATSKSTTEGIIIETVTTQAPSTAKQEEPPTTKAKETHTTPKLTTQSTSTTKKVTTPQPIITELITTPTPAATTDMTTPKPSTTTSIPTPKPTTTFSTTTKVVTTPKPITESSVTTQKVTTPKPIITEVVTTPTPASESTTTTEVITTPTPEIVTLCKPKCTWSPWFDVYTPTSGLDGGEKETYENIMSKGKQVCKHPQDIECKAVDYPDISIDKIGQIVKCDITSGFECLNKDQSGKVKQCYDYKIKVLCCDDYSHCATTPEITTQPLTSTPKASTSEPKSTTTTTTTATIPESTPHECFCRIDDHNYKPGEIIYSKTDNAGCIFIAKCSSSCEIERATGPCIETTVLPKTTVTPKPSTSKHPTTSVPVVHTTPEGGCSSRKINETWINDKCEEVTCQGNNVTTHKPMTCPELKQLTCANGFPPIKKKNADGCCEHYECQCVCSGWGDPHYLTFDGTYYTFLDNCTYVLVQQITPKYDNLRILVDNYYCDAVGGLSCPQSIIIHYKSDEIVLTRMMYQGRMRNRIRFNNDWITPGFTKDGITITSAGINMQVEIAEIDTFISFSGLLFYINLPFSKFGYNTEGQCGTCTNSSTEGCRMPDGQIVKDCSKMAPHWRVNTTQPGCGPHVPLPPPTGPPSPPTTCPPSPLCDIMLSDVFAECHKIINPKAFHKGCVFDACKAKDKDMPCSSLEMYAEVCSQNGICVDWRAKTDGRCSMDCPAGKVYKPCGPMNVKTCENKQTYSPGTGQTEGCYCPDGTTLFNTYSDQCVKSCACVGNDGMPKAPGEKWTSGCHNCICESNTLTVQCEPVSCPPLTPVKCDKEGYVPVRSTKDACCEHNVCQCNTSLCGNKEKPCPIGFRADTEFLAGDCCPTYVCRPMQVCVANEKIYEPTEKVPSTDACQDCSCTHEKDNEKKLNLVKCFPIICNESCSEGFQHEPLEGTCCGHCVQVKCTMKIEDKTITIQPGYSVPSSTDKCTYYECNDSDGHFTTIKKTKDCSVSSKDDCPQGYEYTKEEGECCGKCEQVACVISLKDKTLKILQPGEIFSSPDEPCVKYVCDKTEGHLSAKEVSINCRAENCELGYISQKVEGECCDKCVMVSCVITPPGKSEPVLLKPGESWTPPKDKCITYECTKSSDDHLVTSSKTKDCPVKNQEDCAQGYKYTNEESECCGTCEQVACVMKLKDNTDKLLQPGETWSPPDEPCAIYTCDTTKDNKLSPKETTVNCQKEECEPGYEYKKIEGECCGKCVMVSCVMTPPGESKPITLKPGTTWISPEDKCTTYKCIKTSDDHYVTSGTTKDCSVSSDSDCPQGYKYKKEEGECCGVCEQVACVMKLKDNSIKILQPGEKWSSPDEPCVNHVCEKTEDHVSLKEVRATCRTEDCELGSEPKKIEGECCEKCVKFACVMTTPDNQKQLLKPGETWTSPEDTCTTYKCTKTSDDQFITSSMTKDCSVSSEKDCPRGYNYKKGEGECCAICKQVLCVMTLKDNTDKTLQPGETWSPLDEPCVIYTCETTKDNTLSLKETKVNCPEETCEPGYEYKKTEGHCCGQCVMVSCILTPTGESTPITLQPGETWTSPKDKCTIYECKETSDDHFVTSSKTKDCSVSSDADCAQGYKYKKEEGECCGSCKQVACVMKQKDNTIKILQPNEKWSPPDEPCVNYICENTEDHISLKELRATCRTEDCEIGSEPKKIEGECCEKCVKFACVMTTPDNQKQLLKPGETWTSPEDKCTTYECKKTSDDQFVTSSKTKDCSVSSDTDCPQGYKYEKDQGECCGTCKQVSCVMKLKDNSDKILQPGETWSPPGEPCVIYNCDTTKDNTLSPKETTVNCPEEQCELGYEYKKIEGECCGKCVMVGCVMTPPGKLTPIILKPGETWTSPEDKCTTYDCKETSDNHLVISSKTKDCSVTSANDCAAGYKYKKEEGECCGICEQVACVMKLKDNTIKISQPGETWTSPEDKCTIYECKKTSDDQFITSSKTKDCSVSSDNDCPTGYKYKKEQEECCGICEQVSCVMKLKDNTDKILQPGDKWSPPDEPCVIYHCDTTKDNKLSPKETTVNCQKEECELGYEYKKIEGDCCGKCVPVSCVMTPPGESKPITLQPGEPWTSPEDKCTTYECKKTSDDHFVTSSKTKDCSVSSDTDCAQGYKYKKEEGECCGTCEQVACVMKQKDNTIKILQPGDKWSSPDEPCLYHVCDKTEDQVSLKEVRVTCRDEDCELGSESKKLEGKCCDICVKFACVMTTPENEKKILMPGETWTSPDDKCITYECTKTSDDQFVTSRKTKDCSVSSEKDCPQGYKYKKDEGACCGTCEQVACVMKLKDNSDKLLQPGEKWSPSDEPCVVYYCDTTKDNKLSPKETTLNCPDEQCDIGYEYMKTEGECCGKCVMVACVMTPPGKLTPITMKPDEIWTSPDKCTTYECKKTSDDHLVISSKTKDCSVSSDKDCTEGYQYKKEEGECCGFCEQVACVMKLKDNTTKILQPGDKWISPDEPCVNYVCDKTEDHISQKEVTVNCRTEDCEQGSEPKKIEGECCEKCVKFACVMTTPDNQKQLLKPGETWTSEDKCTTYECKDTSDDHFVTSSKSRDCTVHSQDDCQSGYKYKKEEGECCGTCEQVSCVMKLKNNTDKLLQPGETWSPPDEPCVIYNCEGTDNILTPKETKVNCAEDKCDAGYEYKKIDGECCGKCIKVACVMTPSDKSTPITLKPGETWTSPEDKCTTYECKKTSDDHLVTSSKTKDCTVSSEKDCTQGYTYKKEEGECCGICEQVACVMKDKDGTTQIHQVDEKWNITGEPCMSYECEKIEDQFVPVQVRRACPTEDCEQGYEFKKTEGECCGKCVMVACVMTPPEKSTPITLQPGETWNSPEDKCTTYECTRTSDDHLVISSKTKDCAVSNEEGCSQGYKYKKVDGECCGVCEEVACVMKDKDGTTQVHQPGETWSSHEDKCITYECTKTSDDHFVISSKTKDCSVSSEKDCPQGYTYKKEEGECCGVCEQVACVMNEKDDITKIYQPGETWTSPGDKCTTYECTKTSEDHLVISSKSKDCAVSSDEDCSPGYSYKKEEGECCGICEQVSCIMKNKDGAATTYQPGEKWNITGQPCVSYECEEIEDQFIPVQTKRACPIEDCEQGYEYKKLEDECCGKCVMVACVMTPPEKSTPITLQPGETWTSPEDKCTTYECTKTSDDHLVISSKTKDCSVSSEKDCPQGYEYKKEEGECCGICEQVACVIKDKDGATVVHQPGDIWNINGEPCVSYECEKIEDQFVPVQTKRACPIEDCEQGSEFKKTEGECCGKCVKVACVMTPPDSSTPITLKPGEVYTPSEDKCITYTCTSTYDVTGVNKTCPAFNPKDCVEGTIKSTDDGCCKTCEPIIQRCQAHKTSQKIRSGACESNEIVEISSCGGGCMTSSIYSADSNTMEHKCSCCQDVKTSKKTVTLKCLDGTSTDYTYLYAEECGCTTTECDKESQSSTSQQHEQVKTQQQSFS